MHQFTFTGTLAFRRHFHWSNSAGLPQMRNHHSSSSQFKVSAYEQTCESRL